MTQTPETYQLWAGSAGGGTFVGSLTRYDNVFFFWYDPAAGFPGTPAYAECRFPVPHSDLATTTAMAYG